MLSKVNVKYNTPTYSLICDKSLTNLLLHSHQKAPHPQDSSHFILFIPLCGDGQTIRYSAFFSHSRRIQRTWSAAPIRELVSVHPLFCSSLLQRLTEIQFCLGENAYIVLFEAGDNVHDLGNVGLNYEDPMFSYHITTTTILIKNLLIQVPQRHLCRSQSTFSLLVRWLPRLLNRESQYHQCPSSYLSLHHNIPRTKTMTHFSYSINRG